MHRLLMTGLCNLFFLATIQVQIDKKDMCEFSVRLYERRLTNYGYSNPRFGNALIIKVNNVRYIGAVAISNYFMQQAFDDYNPYSLKRRFENLCNNSSDFDKYIYQILIEGEGSKDNFIYVISAFCGNNNLANKLYSYLISKYSKKLGADINKLKIADKSFQRENNLQKSISDSANKYEARLNEYYNKIKDNTTSQQFTQIANGKSNNNPVESVFNIAEFNINILPSGTLVDCEKKDSIMPLKIPKDYYIEKLFFMQFKSDLVVFVEFSSGVDGSSSIQCLDLITKKVKWDLDINGINLSKGLIEDNYVYISCMGLISKINLETGKFVWQHENLYGKYKCNNFVEIQTSKDYVRFIGINPLGKIIGKSSFDDIVSFICNKNSGQILKIDNKIPAN